jgi:hypothetical protein
MGSLFFAACEPRTDASFAPSRKTGIHAQIA